MAASGIAFANSHIRNIETEIPDAIPTQVDADRTAAADAQVASSDFGG
jgi:hypothetical protein